MGRYDVAVPAAGRADSAGYKRTSLRTDAEDGCKLFLPQPNVLVALLSAKSTRFADYGRIAGLHRTVYAACTGDQTVLAEGQLRRAADERWREIVRSSFVQAWSTKRYSLLDVVAKAIGQPQNHGCAIWCEKKVTVDGETKAAKVSCLDAP